MERNAVDIFYRDRHLSIRKQVGFLTCHEERKTCIGLVKDVRTAVQLESLGSELEFGAGAVFIISTSGHRYPRVRRSVTSALWVPESLLVYFLPKLDFRQTGSDETRARAELENLVLSGYKKKT